MSTVLTLAAHSAPDPSDEDGAAQIEVKALPSIMSPAQLAEELDVSVRTLDMWRANGSGPTPRNPDGTRFYRYYAADVIAWLENKKPGVAAPGSRTTD